MRADVSDASQALMDPTLRTSSKARSRANRTATQALPLTRAGLAALLLVVGLSGCGTSETFVHGQKITQEQLQQAPVGASREQVELALGTPSTTGVTSNEVFYYISQTDVQPVRFLNPRTLRLSHTSDAAHHLPSFSLCRSISLSLSLSLCRSHFSLPSAPTQFDCISTGAPTSL
mgnify:CR=1 FL=1